jgi:hypothetical protein
VTVGSVAAAYAVAWDALGERRPAIRWYERAVAARDGTAPTFAIEQLAKLARARGVGRRRARADRGPPAAVRRQVNASLPKADTRGSRQGDKCRSPEIDAAIELLHKLIALYPSSERSSLWPPPTSVA